MFARRKVSARRSRSGVGPIRRESYGTVSGFNTKSGWWEVRKQIEKRSNNKCEARVSDKRCGAPGVDVHHIISLSKGGTSNPSNLIHLCQNCHAKRHNHLFRAGYGNGHKK